MEYYGTHILQKQSEKEFSTSSLRVFIMRYGAENWLIEKNDQSKIAATEKEYWRRCSIGSQW